MMINAILYLCVLLAWGGSWLAIKWQAGVVATPVSILYRFGLAAALMLVLVVLAGKLQHTNRRDQLFCLLQGACLFSLNFIAFYQATHYIASGLVAVVMSTATLFNAAHNQLIWKQPITRSFRVGSVLGIAGLILLFWSDLASQQWSPQSFKGIGYSLLGTWLFSLGNMVGVRHARCNLKPHTSTTWAMFYGCAILLIIIAVTVPINDAVLPATHWWDNSSRYLAALLYLAIIASVVGFTAYLMLVVRIGANSAAYTLVATPIVALWLSSLFEDYQWTATGMVGLCVVIGGNLCVLAGSDRFNAIASIKTAVVAIAMSIKRSRIKYNR